MTRRTTSSWGRSALALIAGLVVTALLSIATDAVMHATGVFPPWGEPMAGNLFVLATLYRLIATVLGGYVTAALAPHRAMRHVLVLGMIGTIAAVAGMIATWNAGPEFGPRWYPALLVITALPCVWLGGVLKTRAGLLADRLVLSTNADE